MWMFFSMALSIASGWFWKSCEITIDQAARLAGTTLNPFSQERSVLITTLSHCKGRVFFTLKKVECFSPAVYPRLFEFHHFDIQSVHSYFHRVPALVWISSLWLIDLVSATFSTESSKPLPPSPMSSPYSWGPCSHCKGLSSSNSLGTTDSSSHVPDLDVECNLDHPHQLDHLDQLHQLDHPDQLYQLDHFDQLDQLEELDHLDHLGVVLLVLVLLLVPLLLVLLLNPFSCLILLKCHQNL